MLLNELAGKRVLVTGHAGFKGSWLTFLLNALGAKVYGYSLLPDNGPRLYEILQLPQLLQDECIADIRDLNQLQRFITHTEPELVLHLAAQPLVSKGYLDPLTTFQTNVIGTLNVLEACRNCHSVKAVVNVTTDKCYENNEDGRPMLESDPLGGYDPYSASKACSEIVSSSYRRSFLYEESSYLLATARAGNVIGGGDWAPGRLIPDCVRALSHQKPIVIRHPQSTRPWQLVLEPLVGYLCLGVRLLQGDRNCAQSYNFGPQPQEVLTVKDVASIAIQAWGSGELRIEEDFTFHEAGLLTLDIRKAQKDLDIVPVLNAREAIEWSMRWYRLLYQDMLSDMRDISFEQFADFLDHARAQGRSWAND